jgi:hypothetical protein
MAWLQASGSCDISFKKALAIADTNYQTAAAACVLIGDAQGTKCDNAYTTQLQNATYAYDACAAAVSAAILSGIGAKAASSMAGTCVTNYYFAQKIALNDNSNCNLNGIVDQDACEAIALETYNLAIDAAFTSDGLCLEPAWDAFNDCVAACNRGS